MSDNLPMPYGGLPGNSRQVAKAAKAAEATELAIYENHLATAYRREIERQESEALADVVKAALDDELDLLDWGLMKAAGSPAKAELVSRKVSVLSSTNTRRLARHFGA
jgi:hypothetical protein